MKNTHYSNQTFDKVIQRAKDTIETLDQKTQEEIVGQLNHGKALLSTHQQLNAYLYRYGKVHQAKLYQAFEHIPSKLWVEGSISIVDYGSGQGVAEMVLSDCMRNKHLEIDAVKDITLIEPSYISLCKSLYYLRNFFINAEKIDICKNANLLSLDDISPKSQFVLHVFSNVIDLEHFNIRHIANLLNEDVSHNNIILCVSPFYQECTRGKRMDLFGRYLKNYNRVYRFQAHTDNWKKDYSCQIQIFESLYY